MSRRPIVVSLVALSLLSTVGCDPEIAAVKHDARGRNSFYFVRGGLENNLYRVRKAGKKAERVNGDLAASGFVQNAWSDHRGRRVVYSATQDSGSLLELYVTDTKNGENTKLSGDEVDEDASINSVAIGPRSRYAYYTVFDADSNHTDLYRADLKSGGRTRLNLLPEGTNNVLAFDIDRRGRSLVYLATDVMVVCIEAFHVDLKTLEVTKLHEDFAGDQAVAQVELDDKGRFAYYAANSISDDRVDLFRVDLKRDETTRLTPDHELAGVEQFWLPKRGRSVGYTAEQRAENVTDVYSVRGKKNTITQLTPDIELPSSPSTVLFGDRGRFAYIFGNPEVEEPFALYRASLRNGKRKILRPEGEEAFGKIRLAPRQRQLLVSTFSGLRIVNARNGNSYTADGVNLLSTGFCMGARGRFFYDVVDGGASSNGTITRYKLSNGDPLVLNSGMPAYGFGSVDPRERFITFVAQSEGVDQVYRSRTSNGAFSLLNAPLGEGENVLFDLGL